MIKAGWKNVIKATIFHVLPTVGKEKDKGQSVSIPKRAALSTPSDARGHVWALSAWHTRRLSHQFFKHVAELWS